ncbi:MAG: glycoside hydrolase family 38 C-terminal domain-containing protein [Acidobacteriota bacterium]|nr:glycoside hydrolase family 38 C-terminal domain-containing protein [Acidobacteriota bacterium]
MSPRRRLSIPLVLLVLLPAVLALGQDAAPRLPELTARLVGHAHIDLSWLWRWEESIWDVALQTFKGTLAQMDKMPGLTFAQSQPAIYEAVAKADPALFAAIREKVKQGTWIPVGGMWAEPDLNMPDGEALARQLLYGKRYFLENFGYDVTVGWNPDSFGHNWQLPQILAKAGISYYVLNRCVPEDAPAFWWQGKDGTKLLCYAPQGWYNVSLSDGSHFQDALVRAARQSPLRDYMVLYGAGDHGGGPRDSDLEAIRTVRRDPGQPKLEFTTPEAFFKIIESFGPKLPVVSKELNFTFPACYTTQAATKKANREMEGLLVTAEKFSAVAAASGYRDYYPERDIDEAWKIVLRNQFHDILDGSSIGPVYNEALGYYAQARARARRALDFSLETISASIDTRGAGYPVVVYNPLTWERNDIVAFALPGPASGPVRVTDAKGAEIAAQIVTEQDDQGRTVSRLLFVAENVPSLGYKLYRVERRAGALPARPVAVKMAGLENEFFKLTLDPKTGNIVGLYDKTAGREVLKAPASLRAVADEPENMSAWELGLKGILGTAGESGSKIEVVEAGPVRGVLRISSSFRGSTFIQEIALIRGVPRVDLRIRGDWQERNVMIKAVFPLALEADKAEFEIPYGSITRPTDGTEVPALRWIDVADKSGGFGVGILNDGKYGFDVKGSEAGVSLWHGPTYPDPEADRGPQETALSLYPHKGDWKEGRLNRRAREFNAPLLARVPMIHTGSLPAETSFVQAGPANVILTALKKESGYYERGWIVRLYESEGRATDAKLDLPWEVVASETDLIERPLGGTIGRGKSLTIPLKPFEIKTVRLIRK